MCDVRCGVCVVYCVRTDVVPDLDAALVVLVAPLHLVLDELHPTCNTPYVRPDSMEIYGIRRLLIDFQCRQGDFQCRDSTLSVKGTLSMLEKGCVVSKVRVYVRRRRRRWARRG